MYSIRQQSVPRNKCTAISQCRRIEHKPRCCTFKLPGLNQCRVINQRAFHCRSSSKQAGSLVPIRCLGDRILCPSAQKLLLWMLSSPHILMGLACQRMTLTLKDHISRPSPTQMQDAARMRPCHPRPLYSGCADAPRHRQNTAAGHPPDHRAQHNQAFKRPQALAHCLSQRVQSLKAWEGEHSYCWTTASVLLHL